MAKRKQFTFYWSFYDALADLPIQQAQQGAWAIVTYALLGELPQEELEPPVKVAFKMAKPVLDAARKKSQGAAEGNKTRKKKGMDSRIPLGCSSDDVRIMPGCTPDNVQEKEKEVEIEVEGEVEVEIEKELEKESFNTDCVCVNRDTHTDTFERFWNDYPIQLGKQQARDIWLQDPPELDKVMVALACWKKSRQWLQENGRFIPKAATFLKEKYYQQPPKDAVPTGASGYLGRAEVEAIERLMNGNV